MTQEKSFEHERESLIGKFVKFKKFIREDTESLCKQIDEEIISVDRAETLFDLAKTLISFSNKIEKIKTDRCEFLEKKGFD